MVHFIEFFDERNGVWNELWSFLSKHTTQHRKSAPSLKNSKAQGIKFPSHAFTLIYKTFSKPAPYISRAGLLNTG